MIASRASQQWLQSNSIPGTLQPSRLTGYAELNQNKRDEFFVDSSEALHVRVFHTAISLPGGCKGNHNCILHLHQMCSAACGALINNRLSASCGPSASIPGCPSSDALVSVSLRWWGLRCSAGARACCRVSRGGGPPVGLTMSLGAIWDAAAARVSSSDTCRGAGRSLHVHYMKFSNICDECRVTTSMCHARHNGSTAHAVA